MNDEMGWKNWFEGRDEVCKMESVVYFESQSFLPTDAPELPKTIRILVDTLAMTVELRKLAGVLSWVH